MHVGFVLEWFRPHVGGVETLFDELTRGLVARGHQVTVITAAMPGSPMREETGGLRIVRVRTPRVASRYLFTALALPIAMRELRTADVIHTTTYTAAIPAWVAARLLHIPAVITVHEVWAGQWRRLAGLNPFEAFLFRLFESIVLHLPFGHYLCDSQFTRARLMRLMHVAAPKATVAYPVVDPDFWSPKGRTPYPLRQHLGLADSTFIYLYYGRPGVSKGLEYLVRAATLVRSRLATSHLVLLLAHDPPGQRRKIVDLGSALGLYGHLSVLDPVPRSVLPDVLMAADCICVPSISEGFGYSAVEAATLGRPVVATSGHSVEEVIPYSAYYVRPTDVEGLAEAIVRTARSPGRLIPPPRFDRAQHVDPVLAAYSRVLASATARARR